MTKLHEDSQLSNLLTNTTIPAPPHSVPMEQAVLGALLVSPDAWDRVADILKPEDFYRRDHREIYATIRALQEFERTSDVVLVGDRLQQRMPEFNAAYLLELVNHSAGVANLETHARLVHSKALTRRLIDSSQQTIQDAYAADCDDVAALIERAEQRVVNVAEGGQRSTPYSTMRETIAGLYTSLHARHSHGGTLHGLSTGFTDLDAILCGLKGGDLIVVAARPSMGKTALALNIAEACAIEQRQPAMLFSMEMSNLQIAYRLTSSIGRVDSTRLQSAEMDEHEWQLVVAALAKMADAPLVIDDSPALTPTAIRARARRAKREHGLSLIVIDYLQLMQTGGKENRTTEISDIARSLKALAKELDVPVIALSQLNRSVEQRPDKRPIMSDLRESGAIEQDADVILFIYRDEYYNADSTDAGMAEIIVAKQRMGPAGTATLAFNGAYSRFENYSPDTFVGSFD